MLVSLPRREALAGGPLSSFKQTCWTLLGAAQGGDEESQDELVRLYRTPVVRYLQHAGAGQDADDLTQEVFLRLFHRDVLKQARPNAGRFRNLLLAVARNVLRGHWTKANAQKRGGGREILPLDEASVPDAEKRAFQNEWVLSLVERAIVRLEREQPRYHAAMSRSLRGATPAEIAVELGENPKAVRNALHRARKALASYLHDDARSYTANPEDHATELALLTSYLPAR